MAATAPALPADRAVLVTGAAQRIGGEIARALAGSGWFVHLHYHGSKSAAAAQIETIAAAGGAGRALGADLATLDAPGAERLIAGCAGAGPPLRALVNNAALFEHDTIETLALRSWQRHMDLNLRAPILLARAFARSAATLPEDADCAIVNLLDNKVVSTNPDFFSYTISKQALDAATRTLALALAPRVRVCGVAPGITLLSGRQTEAGFARAHRNNPLRRGATPADIARAVLFILDTAAITGQTIVIDGGQSLARPPRDVAFL